MREIIDKDIENLTSILQKTVPCLHSVRLFGSYLTQSWDSKRSDIDIGVITTDDYFRLDRDKVIFDNLSSEVLIISESRQRKALRKVINNEFYSDYKDKFSLHIIAKSEISNILFKDYGKGFFGLNVMKGKRLYGKKNRFDYFPILKKVII